MLWAKSVRPSCTARWKGTDKIPNLNLSDLNRLSGRGIWHSRSVWQRRRMLRHQFSIRLRTDWGWRRSRAKYLSGRLDISILEFRCNSRCDGLIAVKRSSVASWTRMFNWAKDFVSLATPIVKNSAIRFLMVDIRLWRFPPCLGTSRMIAPKLRRHFQLSRSDGSDMSRLMTSAKSNPAQDLAPLGMCLRRLDWSDGCFK